ncbi:conserved hypothetical protein [Histoplasma capsulatum H143]|uniref:Telomere length regulation protein conserved domain-containing protein n=1 Tax=Ajellomyces capsulatus (strain H143) TaxID=544712 RepID=C6HA03_AJECH|nr:conserved hypothetical protein [Histoplasma capsulatum H143]
MVMDELLTAVKTLENREELSVSKPPRTSVPTKEEKCSSHPSAINSLEEVLHTLRSSPDKRRVVQVLSFLDPAQGLGGGFNITAPTAQAARILHILITTTIPDHWGCLGDEDSPALEGDHKPKPKAALLRCLSSLAGIGALVAHLRSLLSKHDSLPSEKHSGNKIVIQDLITVLSSVLKPPDLLFNLYVNISSSVERPAQRQIMWKELISLLAAGKVLSVAAESLLTIKDIKLPRSIHWIGDGNMYASWLGRCISRMASKVQSTDLDCWNYLAQFVGRSLSLGYPAQVVSEIYNTLLLQEDTSSNRFGILLDSLRRHDQLLLFKSLLHDLEKRFLAPSPSVVQSPLDDFNKSKAVSGVSAVVATIVRDRGFLKSQLSEWLVTGSEINIKGIDFRRALLASFGNQQEPILEILRRALDIFGDQLYIKHTPTRGQEANTQIILLTAGYAHRLCPHQLRSITQSGTYLTAISNRLAASSPRARYLGMIVGISLSKLVDPADKAMKFDLEQMESEEALWYMNLTNVKDEVGSISDLKHKTSPYAPKKSKHQGRKAPQVDQPKSSQATSKVLSIEEVSEESDGDFLSYEKPDTDASDSEEDPTLINRSKPNSPVYIRDLLACLQDTGNAERYNLGISTAPTLIRRKASFGTEVAENSEALAFTLAGLQDKYNLPKFQEYKLQSQIALLIAYPLTMGRWFVHTLFNADLSQSQQSTILVALGLSSCELAGFGKEDSDAMSLPPVADSSFPSKRLPSNLANTYGGMNSPIDAISKKLSQATLKPLALHAAKPPGCLIAYRFRSNNVHNPFLIPQLLQLFVQTVTLILSTLGPNSPNLAALTHEALALLITLHNLPVATEPTVLRAILSLFLAVVDLNISSGSVGEERLVTEFVTQVMEMREWADSIFERSSKEEEEVKMLCAGIMVKLGEVMERYQSRLLGTNLGFGY